MYPLDWEGELARERVAEARAAARERDLARIARGPRTAFRARVARRLFQAAVSADREEAWRMVWDRLQAPEFPREVEE